MLREGFPAQPAFPAGQGPGLADDDVPHPLFLGEVQDGLDDVLALIGKNLCTQLFGQGQGIGNRRWVAASITVGSSRGVWT